MLLAKMSEPSCKKIKRTDVKPEEGNNNDEPVPMTVEFKFCSCKTELLETGQMTGTLHIPMLQDPCTGRFRIPAGTTNVEGTAKFTKFRFVGNWDWQFENRFTATFERPHADSLIEGTRTTKGSTRAC